MVVCPNCGFEFNKRIVRLCDRNIAFGKTKDAKRSFKKSIDLKLELYNYLKDFCSNKSHIGIIITTNTFLSSLHVKGRTDGDVIRIMLDSLTCAGYLTKIKFSLKGHQWIVNALLVPCEFVNLDNNFPVCLASQDKFKDSGKEVKNDG